MVSLLPSSKQIAFASSLGISVASSVTTRQLSMLIDKALEEQKRVNDERVQQARDIDMLTLASNCTEMTKQSWRYHCGPCPMAGCEAAEDGFVINTHNNSWFCRKCGDKGTPIGFLMKKENLSFWEAVAELVGEQSTISVPTKKRQPVKKKGVFLWSKDKWQRKARQLVWTSSQRLILGGDARQSKSHSLTTQTGNPIKLPRAEGSDDDANEARRYLNHERAISIETAQAWRLGIAPIKFKNQETNQYEEANAIIIPWMGPNGLIKAIQYRFVGKASRRFHSKYGGEKTIYGAHLLAPSPNKILLIVEGEFNTISIWQEAHRAALPIDVISIGGEGIGDERLSKLLKLVARYSGCIAWLDRAEVAKRVGNYLTYAMLVSSPGGHDANRLAQSGELATIVKVIYEGFVVADDPLIAVTRVKPSQKIYDLLDDAGWMIEGREGISYDTSIHLYKQLEDTLENNDYSVALKIHAQIKTMITKSVWDEMANSIKEKDELTINALHL